MSGVGARLLDALGINRFAGDGPRPDPLPQGEGPCDQPVFATSTHKSFAPAAALADRRLRPGPGQRLAGCLRPRRDCGRSHRRWPRQSSRRKPPRPTRTVHGRGRVCRHRLWLPATWRRTSSADRIVESVRWDRDTLWPKYNLAYRLGVSEVYGTMMLADYRSLLAEHDGNLPPEAIGAAYRILPRGDPDEGARLVRAEPGRFAKGVYCETGSCRVVRYDPLTVEVQAELSAPGLVRYWPSSSIPAGESRSGRMEGAFTRCQSSWPTTRCVASSSGPATTGCCFATDRRASRMARC